MNLLTRIISYDKTKIKNQECNCDECISVENTELKNQTVEYPKLSEEEIEKIIFERYSDKDEKTKTFIRKALRKHGDRYDYSNVIYVKATVNVEIICRVEGHKPFPQTPNNHLSGKGCKICGIKKLTLEEFIERANEIHGIGTYDYSKVNYVDMKTNVTIICPKHGDFPQTPSNHLSGKGCSTCGFEKSSFNQKLTKEEFIRRGNEIYGEGTHDYSKVNYVNYDTEVIIICPKHGEFKQTPDRYLHGHSCQKCGIEKVANKRRKPLWKFIEESNEVHGEGRYDYSKVKYINYNTEVIIICPNHDIPHEFPQTPANHLNGNGCPICSESRGERKVRLYLESNKIEYEIEKRFEGCRYKNPLLFDFYLPQYNLCIEFDGEQHFIPHDFNSKETEERKLENLKIVQLRDQIKNDYCKTNGINLLRIRYDENVEEKLTEYFQEYKI